MSEVRTVIPDDVDRYLDSLVRAGPFASKAELVRAALVSYAETAGPLARGFDRENVIAPDGRVYQLEYARAAVAAGSTGVGVVHSSGVLLASSGALASRLWKGSPKIARVGDRTALLSSGLVGDAHFVAAELRRAAPESAEEVVDSVVHNLWDHGSRRDRRPLAVGFLVATTLGGESRLFGVDPSGAWWEADAGAIGAGEREANALLEKKYRRTGAKEAEALAAEALGRPGRLQIARLPES